MSYEAPYEGLRVVDLSQGIAGPYCAMLLAQYGADVIKVEPKDGDWARHLGKRQGDPTAFSIAGNLGKRSIVLDLKDAGDKAKLWQLIKRADVFLEGFRVGVTERLGFGYEAVAKVNPRALYLSVSGYGQAGPLREKPAMDPILQAFTGFMMTNRNGDGEPQRSGPIIVDMTTALYGFQALSAALFARQKESVGRKIEVNLMQGAANLQVVRMMQAHILGGEPPSGATAPNGAFACKEGYIFIVVLRQDDFVTLCNIIDRPDMAKDSRFQNPIDRLAYQDELNHHTREALQAKTAVQWSEIISQHGIQNELVLNYQEFLQHPQVAANGLISWLRQPGLEALVPLPNPPGTRGLVDGHRLAHAPEIGEHTGEILKEIGH